MSDFNYTSDGLFYRLLPNNEQAVLSWNRIADAFVGGVIPFYCWDDVRSQLRAAGYSVTKARPVKADDDALLAELNA